MSAKVLDGKGFAELLRGKLKDRVQAWCEQGNPRPQLAAVLVGEDPASQVYVRNKQRACEKAGIASQLIKLDADTSSQSLLDLIEKLNNQQDVHGILVQLPLPPQMDEKKVLDAVHPLKDVDCFHPENVGLMIQGRPRYLPCTPSGVLQLLDHYDFDPAGKHAVVLGRSEIVGKPMANLLLQKAKGGNATVTICHSRTENLAEITKQADLLIAAIGKPKFVTAEMVKPGAIVIDVGTNRTEEGLVGDVDFAAVKEIASAITPVPKGVGPLTIAMLLENTFQAVQVQSQA
ncbi:Bifunctional methylenetetrahydrofolate dehydrogenase/methenyltetrahydrofolate cyclohydrolase FolD [Planctomycetales bacterium 10988]|nr:Bifunctional methylenetetrahydrofolate dehydrogenase/methenyltetrahydrofolate cyclohydrolase FolD [Planctomycetales bacterium 10988]